MNTQNEKRTYIAPIVHRITLDNEISLALESSPNPPWGPDESSLAPEYFNNDPYKDNMG
jgi:hypothetical protein